MVVCPAGTAGACPPPEHMSDASAHQPNLRTEWRPLAPGGGQRVAAAGLTDGTVQIGGGGAYHTWPSLKSEVGLDQVFARFDYDLTDNLNVFVQGSGAEDYTSGFPTNLRFFQPTNVGACNPFLAQANQSAFGCTGSGESGEFRQSADIRHDEDVQLPAEPECAGRDMDTRTRNYFVIAGLEGKFGDGYRWEAAYTNSESKLTHRINKNQNLRNTYAAIDAVVNPANGQIVCRVTLTNPDLYPGCVPINLFGPSSESKEAFDYIFQRIEHVTTNELDSIAGSITGAPFNTWAGPLDMALSGEYRIQSYELTSTSPPARQDCVGLRFGNCNPTGNTPVNINVIAPRTPVEQKVAEAAFEFNAPLLKDTRLFQDVNLNAAVRYAEYENTPDDPILPDSSFEATTWKVGITWDIVDQLTVRAATSQDIRAPNLYDLFSPAAIIPNNFTTDVLQTGQPQVNAPHQTGGNPTLEPEVARTTTVGFVYRPTPNWSMSIDGYDIRIEDALATYDGRAVQIQRACYASGGSSPLCALIERGLGDYTDPSPANALVKTYQRAVNIAEQTTWGIDFETNYNTLLASHPFSVRLLVNYQPHLYYSGQELPTVDQAGAAYNQAYILLPAPVWKGLLYVRYNFTESFAVDLSERYRSGLVWSNDPSLTSTDHVPSVAYTNLNTSYTFRTDTARFNVYLNVQNLFDKDPPPSGTIGFANQPNLPTNGYIVGDDLVGRYFTLGVRASF